jgi:Flp pilus assembly protein TadD
MHVHSLPSPGFTRAVPLFKRLALPVVVASSLTLGACSGMPNPFEMASLSGPKSNEVAAEPSGPQTELQKATEYWGKQYEKAPNDPQTAVNYVRNLKALGAKQQALGVIQQAHSANPQHKAVASEYGRLALETDQLAVAEKLLTFADDPVKPDWRTISALGATYAKQGRYREAIPQFERALALSPNQPGVLNNLALAHAMNGQAEKAEPLLRQAAADGSADPKVVQNLSLVLGLQGKYDDAKSVVVRTMPVEEAAEDARYVREMVGVPAASAPSATAAIATSSTAKSKSGAKAKAAPAAPVEDPALTVQRLADGYAGTPTDAPVQLGPKP